MSSTSRCSFAGREVDVEVVRSPRARRLTLRADPVRGVVRVSLPPRGSLREADRFVAAHRDWIGARVAGWPAAIPFAPGATIPFDGGTLTLDWADGRAARTVREGDRLRLGGAAATVPGRTLRWLRAAALADLRPTTERLAARVGRTATVGLGDPASRWGSCAVSGRIRYSWRLILAPPAVRQSVVAHEVAHLVHPNHGPAFWALAAELTDGDLPAARAWLKANGAALHWVGRE
ncbi:MAG: M48 family metallopeptidase [Sphingomonadaceae bacterium]|nr:M48 family metallopeptidase [Sphingomonadaceae bacterium]